MPGLTTNERGLLVHPAPTGEAGLAWSANFNDIARTLTRDRPPAAADDAAAGYVLGDVWRDGSRLWTCVGVDAGAADWREVALLDAAGQLLGPIIVQADDAATLEQTTPVPGQLVYATDGGGLRVGNGATPGGEILRPVMQQHSHGNEGSGEMTWTHDLFNPEGKPVRLSFYLYIEDVTFAVDQLKASIAFTGVNNRLSFGVIHSRIGSAVLEANLTRVPTVSHPLTRDFAASSYDSLSCGTFVVDTAVGSPLGVQITAEAGTYLDLKTVVEVLA